MIKVNLVNEQNLEFDGLNIKKVLRKIAKKINRVEKVKGKHYISFIIVVPSNNN